MRSAPSFRSATAAAMRRRPCAAWSRPTVAGCRRPSSFVRRSRGCRAKADMGGNCLPNKRSGIVRQCAGLVRLYLILVITHEETDKHGHSGQDTERSAVGESAFCRKTKVAVVQEARRGGSDLAPA